MSYGAYLIQTVGQELSKKNCERQGHSWGWMTTKEEATELASTSSNRQSQTITVTPFLRQLGSALPLHKENSQEWSHCWARSFLPSRDQTRLQQENPSEGIRNPSGFLNFHKQTFLVIGLLPLQRFRVLIIQNPIRSYWVVIWINASCILFLFSFVP